MSDDHDIGQLLAIMARLRDPQQGCPWDLEQDFHSIAPHTIEEAYEVADAIERESPAELRGELGDLLFQVVFHARMAEEAGHFDFQGVVAGLCEKMIRRHPHVFGDARIDSAAAQSEAWEARKAQERLARAKGQPGALQGVALNLPALSRAAKLTRRAAAVGFDWPDLAGIRAKLAEEIAEFEDELEDDKARDSDRAAAELGDILFVICNLARRLEIDPEAALRRTNAKFERRFAAIEARLAALDKTPQEVSLDELDRLWDEAKKELG